MKVLVFDKYIGYNVGGAQQSLRTLLSGVNLSDISFSYLGCEVSKSFSASKNVTNELAVENFKIFELPRFPYLEYFINRSRIKKAIQSHKADLLVTQGLWGAMAVGAFSGKSVFFIRDEYQLNRIPFYQGGIKKFFKFFYLLLQLPFILVLFYENKKAIIKSTVVANSKYIQSQIKNKFGCDSFLIYPPVSNLKGITRDSQAITSQQYLTCIGSEFMKGAEIVKQIAKALPDRKFMIVGRDFKTPVQDNNILFHPWTKNILEIFQKTKIVLAPSICQEAFSRVILEAATVGVPSICSNRGGMPEVALESLIVKDIWNIKNWIEKIDEVDKKYDYYSSLAKNKSLDFNMEKEINKFESILVSLSNK